MFIKNPPTTIRSEQMRSIMEYASVIFYEALKLFIRAQVTLLHRLYSQYPGVLTIVVATWFK